MRIGPSTSAFFVFSGRRGSQQARRMQMIRSVVIFVQCPGESSLAMPAGSRWWHDEADGQQGRGAWQRLDVRGSLSFCPARTRRDRGPVASKEGDGNENSERGVNT